MKAYCILIILVLINPAACKNRNYPIRRDAIHVENNLSHNPAFLGMDKHAERLSFSEKRDTFSKRSSEVVYTTGDSPDAENSMPFDDLNCRAYLKLDTLYIYIGISFGDGGRGFMIALFKDSFFTKPYKFTDVVSHDQPPVYRVIRQELFLDRGVYKTGDSLYGRIDFASEEILYGRTTERQAGKGFFRARIRSSSF